VASDLVRETLGASVMLTYEMTLAQYVGALVDALVDAVDA